MKSEIKAKRGLTRWISFIITLGLVLNMLLGVGLLTPLRDFIILNAHAEEEEVLPEYTPTHTSFNVGTVNFQTILEFVDYCYLYKRDASFGLAHQNDQISIPLTGEQSNNRNLGQYYVGLGSREHPFNGTVTFLGTNSQDFSLPRAFFGYVNDNVILYGNGGNTGVVLQLTRNASVGVNESSPLFADCVVHGTRDDNATFSWNIEAVDSDYTYSGLIGEIGENAIVRVSFTNNSSADMVSNSSETNSDIGAICGKMGTGSSLTVTSYTGTDDVSITSSNGNAGGFVGTLEGTASLNVTSIPADYAPSVTSNSGKAGGIAGYVTSDATVVLPASVVIAGTIVGDNCAGGLYGYYLNKETTKIFDISSYYNGITATATGTYAGGLFGIFENYKNESVYSITFTGTNTVDAHVSGNLASYDTTGYYGGLIGCYKTDKLADSLILRNLTMKSGRCWMRLFLT